MHTISVCRAKGRPISYCSYVQKYSKLPNNQFIYLSTAIKSSCIACFHAANRNLQNGAGDNLSTCILAKSVVLFSPAPPFKFSHLIRNRRYARFRPKCAQTIDGAAIRGGQRAVQPPLSALLSNPERLGETRSPAGPKRSRWRSRTRRSSYYRRA